MLNQRTASRRDQEPQRRPRALELPAPLGTSSQWAWGVPGPMLPLATQWPATGSFRGLCSLPALLSTGLGQAEGRPQHRGRRQDGRLPFRLRSPPQANLTKSQNEFKIVLKELEDSLLARLSAASGNFLGDTALVENLETTKHTASEIEEKVTSPPPPQRAAREGARVTAAPRLSAESPQDGSEGAQGFAQGWAGPASSGVLSACWLRPCPSCLLQGARGKNHRGQDQRGERELPAGGREGVLALLHTERPEQDQPHLPVLPQGGGRPHPGWRWGQGRGAGEGG